MEKRMRGWFSDHPVTEPVYVMGWGEDVLETAFKGKTVYKADTDELQKR